MKAAVIVNKALVEKSDCLKHPKYQALKPPTSGCEVCQQIYDMAIPRQKVHHLISEGP